MKFIFNIKKGFIRLFVYALDYNVWDSNKKYNSQFIN